MIDPSIRLRRAILLHDVSLVKRIVGNNPQIIRNPDFGDKSNTSLHLAAREGSVEIVDFLIHAGHEDISISRNADGDTPLMVAAASEKVEVGELLIKHFPWCVPWQNKDGLDALMLSGRHESSTPLIPVLLSAALPDPSLPNPTALESPSTQAKPPPYPHPLVLARDANGSTALHHASAAGALKALRLLLMAGANPRDANAFAWDPVQYSASVAAEVYFKNLVAEWDRRRAEAAEVEQRRLGGGGTMPPAAQQGQQQQQQEGGAGAGGRRAVVGGGVRLVTEGLEGGSSAGAAAGVEDAFGGVPLAPSKSWSPVERKGPGTPTTAGSAKTTDWRFVQPGGGARGRAWSGE
ncbi:MAG: hypothetical protein M1821_008719 [Bathelium mastoideum]|nr:MAG: hypothetical protein M1821_008719 [Bathelium mastoideum]